MSRQYTEEERAKAKERMRRLRANPDYVQRERERKRQRHTDLEHEQQHRDAIRERCRRLRTDPEYAQRDREEARERMRKLRGNTIYAARELEYDHLMSQHDALNPVGNRPHRRVYDSWYTLRRRALQAGEPDETILTLDQWASIVDHYRNVCLCCGAASELTFDHVLPISMGGTFTADNIQPLCLPCNMAKRNRHIDYRPDGGAFAQSLLSFGDLN